MAGLADSIMANAKTIVKLATTFGFISITPPQLQSFGHHDGPAAGECGALHVGVEEFGEEGFAAADGDHHGSLR